MTAVWSRIALYAVAGQDGPWHYVGQATYVDDEGREVEHDWVRMVQDDGEVWCPPEGVRELVVESRPIHVLAMQAGDDPQDHRAA